MTRPKTANALSDAHSVSTDSGAHPDSVVPGHALLADDVVVRDTWRTCSARGSTTFWRATKLPIALPRGFLFR